MSVNLLLMIAVRLVLLVAALWLLDRLGLYLEDRGLLFYRRKKPTSSALSSLVAMQQFIEPGVAHIVRAGQQSRSEQEQQEIWDRLLICLRAVLAENSVNREAVRLYLAHAAREGLPYEKLYEEATRGIPIEHVPALEDVAPLR
jgi:hypothetical protein